MKQAEIKITNIEIRNSKYRTTRPEKSRIHFHIQDESVIDNLNNRRSRPYNEYRKFLPLVFKAIKEETGYKPEKASWSQKAGCPCGCSPAFIVTGSYGKDIFVTIEAA